MRVSLRARQTAAVTLLIALAMIALSVQHLANLARVGLEDSRGIGDPDRPHDLSARARRDCGRRRSDHAARSATIRASGPSWNRPRPTAATSPTPPSSITKAAPSRTASPPPKARRSRPEKILPRCWTAARSTQIRTIYADRALELALPLELGDAPFGAIRVGLSPVLIRNDLTQALRPMLCDDGCCCRRRRFSSAWCWRPASFAPFTSSTAAS